MSLDPKDSQSVPRAEQRQVSFRFQLICCFNSQLFLDAQTFRNRNRGTQKGIQCSPDWIAGLFDPEPAQCAWCGEWHAFGTAQQCGVAKGITISSANATKWVSCRFYFLRSFFTFSHRNYCFSKRLNFSEWWTNWWRWPRLSGCSISLFKLDRTEHFGQWHWSAA